MGKNREKERYPSLYDAFDLGDRVKRFYKENNETKELRGIVLAINNNGLEIYWDTIDGKYRPGSMNVAFTNCSIDEIYNGSGKYSPIEKYRNY